MNITTKKTSVKTRSSSEVSPCPVRKLRIVSSSRMRATVWPAGAGLEIGERQAEEMMEQPPAELDVHPVGGVAERIGAQELQDRLEQARA